MPPCCPPGSSDFVDHVVPILQRARPVPHRVHRPDAARALRAAPPGQRVRRAGPGAGMTTVERPAADIVELRPVNADLFRALLRRQATSVTVVTAVARATDPACLGGRRAHPGRASPPPRSRRCRWTRRWSRSASAATSSSWPVLARAEHVAVHLLGRRAAGGRPVFATSGIDRFAAYPDWTTGPFGVPLLGGVLARLLCRVVHRVPAGDHTLVIAEPLALGDGGDGAPLVHHRGGYTTAARRCRRERHHRARPARAGPGRPGPAVPGGPHGQHVHRRAGHRRAGRGDPRPDPVRADRVQRPAVAGAAAALGGGPRRGCCRTSRRATGRRRPARR